MACGLFEVAFGVTPSSDVTDGDGGRVVVGWWCDVRRW